jgi:uncharacterized membrane protein
MNKPEKRFHLHDLAELILGSLLIAFPVAMTEEAWNLGDDLPVINAMAIVVLALFVTSWFIYHKHYQSSLASHGREFALRIFVTYTVTLIVAVVCLAVLNQFPIWSDPMNAINRMLVVATPASAAATIVDSLK